MTDEDLVIAMSQEIERCARPMEIGLRAVSAFQLAALLQLALRHPGASGPAALAGRTFIEHVRAYFADQQALAVLEVLHRGDDPQQDLGAKS